ncbi:hypothetical protein GGI35DRAFT_82316 [Trichoderma velutinum]
MNAMRLKSKHIAEKTKSTSKLIIKRTGPGMPAAERNETFLKVVSCRHKSRCNICITRMPLYRQVFLYALFPYLLLLFFFSSLVQPFFFVCEKENNSRHEKDKARLARWWLYPQRDCCEAFQPRVYVRLGCL